MEGLCPAVCIVPSLRPPRRLQGLRGPQRTAFPRAPKDSTSTLGGAGWKPRAPTERKRNCRCGTGANATSGTGTRNGARSASRKRGGDRVFRFKQAQKAFIQVTRGADFDPKAKVRADELRRGDETRSRNRQDPPPQAVAGVKASRPRSGTSSARLDERVREKGRGVEKDEGLER